MCTVVSGAAGCRVGPLELLRLSRQMSGSGVGGAGRRQTGEKRMLWSRCDMKEVRGSFFISPMLSLVSPVRAQVTTCPSSPSFPPVRSKGDSTFLGPFQAQSLFSVSSGNSPHPASCPKPTPDLICGAWSDCCFNSTAYFHINSIRQHSSDKS